MPRLARTVVAGCAHHITQRGNNRQDVFFVDDDRHFWLAMRYVELNPVRAKLCRKPWRYEWSSAGTHVDAKARSELLNLPRWYDMISKLEKLLGRRVRPLPVGRPTKKIKS